MIVRPVYLTILYLLIFLLYTFLSIVYCIYIVKKKWKSNPSVAEKRIPFRVGIYGPVGCCSSSCCCFIQ
jgi:hypothetical protein